MKFKSLALGLALALALVAPAEAQRGGGGRGDWELLGETRVGFGADRDIIDVGRDEGYFRGRGYRRLRFVAEGGEVRMRSVRLHYLNGHSEDLALERNLKSGENVEIDLRGERSYLRQVEMFYKGKFGLSLGGGGLRVEQPTVRVFAENARRGPQEVVVVDRPRDTGPRFGGFDEITRKRFNRTDFQIQMEVGRSEGRFNQIRLRNTSGEAIHINEIIVQFGNGQDQVERLDQRLDPGEMTSPIDLDGERRFVKGLTLLLKPRRASGPAELTLLASQLPGRGDDRRPPPPPAGFRPSPDWVPLGQQTVGFGVDRDRIDIGQSEDFFRNRGFDRLHFVAENNEIHLMAIRVVYLNGHSEDINVDRLIRVGSDLAVDLPGRRSFLREIEMTYRARPGFRGQAVMSVYGEPSRR